MSAHATTLFHKKLTLYWCCNDRLWRRRGSTVPNNENDDDNNNNNSMTASPENMSSAPSPPNAATTTTVQEGQGSPTTTTTTTTTRNPSYEMQEVDRLLSQDPERAAHMYRNYVIRERRRQLARQQRQEQQAPWLHSLVFWQRISRPIRSNSSQTHSSSLPNTTTTTTTVSPITTATTHPPQSQENATTPIEAIMTTTTTAMHPTHSATTMSSVVWDATVIDPRLSDRLVLKTKIYQSTQQQPLSSSLISEDRHQENENSNNDDIEQSQSTPPFSSSTHDTLSPPPSTPTETEPTATPSSAWSLPNLLFSRDRDAATLEEMDDEMEHGIRCAICLIRLQDGDVIGDIPCGHAFHKDCLKDWLKRKNRCPLCQQTGVAKLYQRTSASRP
jgi:hypothetical protein